MMQAQQPQGGNPSPGMWSRLVSGFWTFMRTAFVFFSKVLEAVKHDTRLAILWGFGVLFLVILVSVLVLANDLPDYAKLTTIILIILVLLCLFAYTVPRRILQELPSVPDPRNPFGVQDVPDPYGQDVQDFAAKVKLTGKDDDVNASDWANSGGGKEYDSLEGAWSCRWNYSAHPDYWYQGTAQLRTRGDVVFILAVDKTGGPYLLEASRRRAGRLVGRYLNPPSGDTSPWVGLVVDNQRIDGRCRDGRCDFRR